MEAKMFFVHDVSISEDGVIFGRGATAPEAVADARQVTGDDYRLADEVACSLGYYNVLLWDEVRAIGRWAAEMAEKELWVSIVWTTGQWYDGQGSQYGGVFVEEFESEEDWRRAYNMDEVA
jgi:hypothetical protein